VLRVTTRLGRPSIGEPGWVRRLPVVENGGLVGIVAQADVALRETEKTGELVEAISERSEGERR